MSPAQEALGSVPELFVERARRSPNSIALILPRLDEGLEPLTVTYSQLDALSSQLAARLHAEAVKPGDFVAIMMSRSIEMVVSMLAVLKCGAAYVPLDQEYPAERLGFLIADTSAVLCLTQPGLLDRTTWPGVRVMVPDAAVATAPSEESWREAGASLGPDAAAYVMYTSGSTGTPKGVVVPHRAIASLVRGVSYARLDETRAILHLAPASFDASTFEVWGALLNGARCVLAPHHGIPDPAQLRRIIESCDVTTVWLTASLFNTIIDSAPQTLETVSEVLTGGEALSVTHIRKAHDLLPGVQLINGYGPTETTTFACCHRIPRPLAADCRSIPIGSPVGGRTIHLLDAALRPVARGEAGDLYVGGDGVAIGYLNRPRLTAERFITHPVGSGARLYKTGDRARVLPDGTLEFLGRDDDQVKIRGYRVELGEIEAAMRGIAGVTGAAVTLREDRPGDKRLVAYYACAAHAPVSAERAREHLATKLPEHMVPSRFVLLDALPLTSSGKVDRQGLPAPDRRRPVLERAMVVPRTPAEEWVASAWRQVLDLDEIGVNDRFFELGGTSLAALRLITLLSADMRTRLPAVLLFRAGTVAELAAILEGEYAAFLPAKARRSMSSIATSVMADRAAERRQELRDRRLRRRYGA